MESLNAHLFHLMSFLSVLLLLNIISIYSHSLHIHDHQQSSLLNVKQSLVFNPKYSTKLITWSSSTGCCDWSGVFCDGRGHVVALDLSDESISGGLENSTALLNLPFLQELDLSTNNLDTTIPAWFGNLTELTYLDLSYNGFTGQIPFEISHLTRLATLDLSSNMFNTSIPAWFGNFTELTHLYVSLAFFDGQIPIEISQLTRLVTLDISDFLNTIPTWFGNLTELTHLYLGGFVGQIPIEISHLENLVSLDLSFCHLNGTFPMNIFQLPSLEILDLSRNELLEGSFPEFHQNLSLQTLVLTETGFSGRLPESIGNLRNLSRIDLSHCHFGGTIPSSLFSIPSLQEISFSSNQFSGTLPNFSNASSSLLNYLDLSDNGLEGSIPTSFFELKRLNKLYLSSNKFNDTLLLDQFQKLNNLTFLDLSYNNLTVKVSARNSAPLSFPQLSTLKLASCNMRVFPNLKNQSNLNALDLSNNQISGIVPNWIWDLGNRSLFYLDLSHNFLVGLQQPYSIPTISFFDLHNNQLQGNIPIPASSTYVDFSSNNFNSFIQDDIGAFLSDTTFFSLSKNGLKGAIPQSICNASGLAVLDLSDNHLNGTIPNCLTMTADILNLRGNDFSGNFPDDFPDSCTLTALDLNGNRLMGKVPRSLSNCTLLEVLDLGNNQINDIFPCFLKNISWFRVLVLRNNMFNGCIDCSQSDGDWSGLQIIDLAHNHFSGHLPKKDFKEWREMTQYENETRDIGSVSLNSHYVSIDPQYVNPRKWHDYQVPMTATNKGSDIEYEKILAILKSVDLSSNNFTGPIPKVLGRFIGLYALNLSHNSLDGPIPSSFGNLSQLESLDLSVNHLTGAIPQQLARLTFLSVLNLSNNNLVGIIPTSTQLQSFSSSSFEGNLGLCGPPLLKPCLNITGSTPVTSHSSSGTEIDWNFISVEMGFVFGFGIVIGPLLLWKRWRMWYCKQVDRVLFKIFPKLNGRKRNHERRGRRSGRH